MSEENRSNTPKKIMWLLFFIFLLMIGIGIWMIYCQPCDQCETPFGDGDIQGTFSGDAYAITIDGGTVGDGIEILADTPKLLISDDFEGTLGDWDTIDDASISTETSYGGSSSVFFDSSIDGKSYIENNTLGIEVDADETIEVYVYINASSNWDDDDDDYFLMNITFVDDNSLIYVILGSYVSTSSSEAVISTPSLQVTALDDWVGINIENIDADYGLQFDPSLPIPDVFSVNFSLSSAEGENVYMDDFELYKTPKLYLDGSFWKQIPSNQKVTSYAVTVDYKVVATGDIDPDFLYLRIKLYATIYSSPAKITELQSRTLLQNELFKVTNNVDESWTSKAFDLPDDGSVLGNDLYYVYDLELEAWGKLTFSNDYIGATESVDEFDALQFEYVEFEGELDIIVYTIGGIGVGLGSTFLGLFIKKRKKKGIPDELTAREKMLNDF